MERSEHFLLKRFVEYRDNEAFSEIVKCYADPVYNTCKRILFDEAGAADAAQETFYQLMCNAGAIRGSLGGWLHSVATKNAIGAIRRNSSRRLRERRYALSRAKEVNQWKDISPYIDRELEKLPAEQKAVLIRYFFEGKSMAEIAEIENVSQPTISRKINTAIEELRKCFHKQGIIVSLVILASLIEHSTLHAAPAALFTETSKMSLAGMTSGLLTSSTQAGYASAAGMTGSSSMPTFSAAAMKTGISAVFSTLKAKIVTAVIVAAVGTGTVISYNIITAEPDIDKDEIVPTAEVEPIIADIPTNNDPFNQPIVLSQMSISGMGMGGGRSAEIDESEDLPLNLNDPEMTVDTFLDLLVTNEMTRWDECFIADSPVPTGLKQILTAPRNLIDRQLQKAYTSIGHPIEILELYDSENGLMITFLCTVYESFSISNGIEVRTWAEGDQFEINAEMVCIEGQWKLVDVFTTFPALPKTTP